MSIQEFYEKMGVVHGPACNVCTLAGQDTRVSYFKATRSVIKRHNVDLVIVLFLMMLVTYVVAIHFMYMIVGGL